MEEHLPEKAIPHRTMNLRISEKKNRSEKIPKIPAKKWFPQ